MSGLFTICEITAQLESSCGFDSLKHIPFGGALGYWMRCGFTLADYFPLLITVGKMVIGAIMCSSALYIGGIGLFADYAVNVVLQNIFAQQGPHPCVTLDVYQMPALASQTSMFFISGFVLFGIIYRRVFGAYLLTLIFLLGTLGMYKRVFDHINTNEQLVVGAIVGFADALWMHAALYWLIRPHMPFITTTPLARMLRAKNFCFDVERELDVEEREWFDPQSSRNKWVARTSIFDAKVMIVPTKPAPAPMITASARMSKRRRKAPLHV